MFLHYLVTRFNIRVDSHGPEVMVSPAMDDDWLQSRLFYFQQYCIPSVLDQSQTDFTWLIYFDTETPNHILEALDFLTSASIKIEFRFVNSYDSMIRDLQKLIRSGEKPFVITSRLDNDDVLGRNFIHLVQSSFRQQHHTVINFLCGYEYSLQSRVLKLWNVRYKNQFISLIESVTAPDITSVYGFPHWRLPPDAYIINLQGAPQWLYLRHSHNYSDSKITGIPQIIRPEALKNFPKSIQALKFSFFGTLRYAARWLPHVIRRRLGLKKK